MQDEIPFYVYVDVDDTLVRTFGSKQMPVLSTIQHVRDLFQQGAVLYCWSSAGAEYARRIAKEYGIDGCFSGFLPKPHLLIDDQNVSDWRYLKQIHPGSCPGKTLEEYRQRR